MQSGYYFMILFFSSDLYEDAIPKVVETASILLFLLYVHTYVHTAYINSFCFLPSESEKGGIRAVFKSGVYTAERFVLQKTFLSLKIRGL